MAGSQPAQGRKHLLRKVPRLPDHLRELLALWRDRRRASGDVKRLALAHAAALEEKTQAIAEMSRALRHLADRCDGDGRPDCPILDELADAPGLEPETTWPSRRGPPSGLS